MYVLKTFITIGTAIDNTHKVIAPFGELSTKALTYAKDVKQYTNAEYPGIKSNVFVSRRDADRIDVRMNVHNIVMMIAHYIYERGMSGGNTSSSDNLLINLDQEFNANISELSVGDMVYDEVAYMPSVVRFYVNDPLEPVAVVLWMSDAAFRTQFDEFQIDVVAPLDDIDLLMTSNENVRELTKDLSISKAIDRLEQATQDYPYTLARTYEFPVVNINDPEDIINLPWSVAIYGIAGDNIDAIYDAITKYILDNSKYDRDIWNNRIPILFKRIEFTIIPIWNQYSVPNKSIESGLYSPLVKRRDVENLVISYAPTYSATHAVREAVASGFLYKSLGIVITSSSENRDNTFDIRDVFSDFALISTTHHDFNRLSPKTRDLVMLLNEMFRVAEEMTEFSVLPNGLARVRREGNQYVVATLEQVQFYVLAKNSFAGA